MSDGYVEGRPLRSKDDYLFKSKQLCADAEVWYIEIDGRRIKLPTKKSGWVSIGAAKTALRLALNGRGAHYEDFLLRHVKFIKVQ